MAEEKKVGPTDFQAEVARLQQAGQMPSLEQVLDAVVNVRKKYAPAIKEARAKGDDE